MTYLPSYRRPEEFRPEHYQHITDDRWWWFFVVAPWDRRHWRSLSIINGLDEEIYFGPGRHPPTFYGLAQAVVKQKMPFATVHYIHAALHQQYLAEGLFRARIDHIINRWPYTAITGLDPRSAPIPLPPEPEPFEPVTGGSNVIPFRRRDETKA